MEPGWFLTLTNVEKVKVFCKCLIEFLSLCGELQTVPVEQSNGSPEVAPAVSCLRPLLMMRASLLGVLGHVS